MRICLPPTRPDFAYGILAASAACLALGLAGCKSDPVERSIDPALLSFERGYSEGLPYESKAGVKLIGFKTMTIPREAIEQFDAVYQANRAKLRHYYLDKANRLLRIYFPVESALVEVDGGVIEANALGELDIAPADPALRTIGVVGRQQTPSIRGVQGNIIKNGIIYLARKNEPDHVSGDLYVFDFGVKLLVDHGAHEEAAAHAGKTGGASIDSFDGGGLPPPADLGGPPPADLGGPPPPPDLSGPSPDLAGPPPPSDLGTTPDMSEECTLDATAILALRSGEVGSRISALEEGKCKSKVNCMANHGGPNCSNAFGINKGRCPFDATVCMDYNGIATNCVNAGSGFWKYWNFPDSDCDVALAMGHCWNELM